MSPEGSFWNKVRHFFAVGLESQKSAWQLIQIRCERGAEITRLMGFPEETAQAIRNLDEHWDGAGHPDGLKQDEIPLLARICGLAQTLEVFYSGYGPARAEEIAKSRRKKSFDPELVDTFWRRPEPAGSGRTSAARTSRARSPAWNRRIVLFQPPRSVWTSWPAPSPRS